MARVSETTVRGWEAVVLESEALRAVLLPGKGGDLWELRHLPTGIQVLWQAPWGLPAGPRLPVGAEFEDWYAGGWQDLLPNYDEACEVDGVRHSLWGESWALPWSWRQAGDAVELTVALETVPLRVEKALRLRDATLVVEERLENTGADPVRFIWGHHPALGGDFLAAGCEIDLPGGRTEGYHELVEESSVLAPRAQSTWPEAIGRDGRSVDLRRVPGPERRSHDVTLVTELAAGWLAVRNPRLGLGFALRFPRDVFRWLWIWQAYGGADMHPFAGRAYTLALEPWTGPPGLARAVARGEATRLEPGASLEATLEATVFEGTAPVRAVEPAGRILR